MMRSLLHGIVPFVLNVLIWSIAQGTIISDLLLISDCLIQDLWEQEQVFKHTYFPLVASCFHSRSVIISKDEDSNVYSNNPLWHIFFCVFSIDSIYLDLPS